MFTEEAKKFEGQKVAVLAARYQYRGILSQVSKDCIVLANALAVESSGASSLDRASREDAIFGSVIIKTDAIEILYQPKWVFAPLPGEDGYDGRTEDDE